jgi:hypothetical protein
MQTWIAEADGTGHRLWYVSLLAQAALSRGDQVKIVLSARAADTAERRTHLAGFEDRIEILNCRYFYRSLFHRAVDVGINLLVVPDGDRIAIQIGLLPTRRRWPRTNLLVMRTPESRWRPKSAVKHIAISLASHKSGIGIFYLASGVTDPDSLRDSEVRDPAPFPETMLGDAVTDRVELGPGRYWFGILGAISARKNLPVVATAIANCGYSDVGLVVAGELAPGVLDAAAPSIEEMRLAGQKVSIHDRLLSEGALTDLLENLDCLILAHSNEGPSGLLLRGVQAGCRILASGASSLRRDCQALDGATWVALEVPTLCDGVRQMLHTDRPRTVRISVNPELFEHRLLGI